jgi:hypothetical protein
MYFVVVSNTAGIERVETFEREESALFWARCWTDKAAGVRTEVYAGTSVLDARLVAV